MNRLFLILLFFACCQIHAFSFLGDSTTFKSSSFRESRQSRFHLGTDFTTGGKVGWPVYAPCNGSITRIQNSSWGFGKSLLLRCTPHTEYLFAHLWLLTPEDEEHAFLHTSQTKDNHYTLYPNRKVKKGAVLAWAGSSGAGYPHLHVERRINGVPATLLPSELPQDTMPPRLLRTVQLDSAQWAVEAADYAEAGMRNRSGIYQLTTNSADTVLDLSAPQSYSSRGVFWNQFFPHWPDNRSRGFWMRPAKALNPRDTLWAHDEHGNKSDPFIVEAMDPTQACNPEGHPSGIPEQILEGICVWSNDLLLGKQDSIVHGRYIPWNALPDTFTTQVHEHNQHWYALDYPVASDSLTPNKLARVEHPETRFFLTTIPAERTPMGDSIIQVAHYATQVAVIPFYFPGPALRFCVYSTDTLLLSRLSTGEPYHESFLETQCDGILCCAQSARGGVFRSYKNLPAFSIIGIDTLPHPTLPNLAYMNVRLNQALPLFNGSDWQVQQKNRFLPSMWDPEENSFWVPLQKSTSSAPLYILFKQQEHLPDTLWIQK
jgi:murein DD-endopeptidase MepM/ murein hydrolase activator NlpD